MRGLVPSAWPQGDNCVRTEMAKGGFATRQPGGGQRRPGPAREGARVGVHAQPAPRRQAPHLLRRPIHPATRRRDRRHSRLQRQLPRPRRRESRLPQGRRGASAHVLLRQRPLHASG